MTKSPMLNYPGNNCGTSKFQKNVGKIQVLNSVRKSAQ